MKCSSRSGLSQESSQIYFCRPFSPTGMGSSWAASDHSDQRDVPSGASKRARASVRARTAAEALCSPGSAAHKTLFSRYSSSFAKKTLRALKLLRAAIWDFLFLRGCRSYTSLRLLRAHQHRTAVLPIRFNPMICHLAKGL